MSENELANSQAADTGTTRTIKNSASVASQPSKSNAVPVCPVCGASTFEIRGKLHCSRCHTICETCCEGGPQ